MKQTGRYVIYFAVNCVKYLQVCYETVCKTCIDRFCSNVKTLLRRKDTFDPVCFLYPSHLRISKAKNVKRKLLQSDNFYQSSDKKATCLKRTEIKILGISKKQRTKLEIFFSFLKKKHFFRL